MRFSVTRVDFVAAHDPRDRTRGLLGWAKVWLNEEFGIDSVAVRRTQDGRVVVSFPRRGGHPVVSMRTRDLRSELEREIVAELRRQGRLAS